MQLNPAGAASVASSNSANQHLAAMGQQKRPEKGSQRPLRKAKAAPPPEPPKLTLGQQRAQDRVGRLIPKAYSAQGVVFGGHIGPKTLPGGRMGYIVTAQLKIGNKPQTRIYLSWATPGLNSGRAIEAGSVLGEVIEVTFDESGDPKHEGFVVMNYKTADGVTGDRKIGHLALKD